MDRDHLRDLGAQLRWLRAAMRTAERERAADIARVHRRHQRSAVNLVHYVALRQHDLRSLQHALARLGLSSLGRSEPHVLASFDAVIAAIDAMLGEAYEPPPPPVVGIGEGDEILRRNADDLLGPAPPERSTRIMVTIPSDGAHDPGVADAYVAAGMDLARVNCAHDDPDAWRAMIGNVRAAAARHGRPCRVAMDLAGPKLRTGPLAPGPQVVRLSPTRDDHGRVVSPVTVRLTAAGDPGDGVPTLPVDDPAWLARLAPGDTVALEDTREARRRLVVTGRDDHGVLAEVHDTTYVGTGTALHHEATGTTTAVGPLPPLERAIPLAPGDRLVLTRDLTPVEPPAPGGTARLGCTLPEVFDDARPGERVYLDDGKIAGVITEVTPDELVIEVTGARKGGARLKAEKGINLPDTALRVAALTAKDLEDLAFVAAHADIVNFSFVRHPADVLALQARLEELDRPDLGIILKVETVAAFHNLPELLLAAMRSERVGVMIARGDLAVEAGYERLAEVQEEILWLCEAAHVPVIWATQVLDTLARTGLPSRAEVTDAASGERAECVMLNKGPHITEAIAVLADILRRMDAHQHKKRGLLRRLRAWDEWAEIPPGPPRSWADPDDDGPDDGERDDAD